MTPSDPYPRRVPVLLHLNGASGVGKSTLAHRFAAERPGTLLCDIDGLRTLVSGWEDDFVGTGDAVRTTALAMITAYLRTGRDVVLPQLIVTPSEADRFRAAADEAGAAYVGVVLRLDGDALLARLHARPDTPVTAVVRRIIAERGGDPLVLSGQEQLLALAPTLGLTVVDADDAEAALATLADLVDLAGSRP